MAIRNRYQISVEQPIASYDYFDIAARVGYKTFYPAMSTIQSSGAAVCELLPNNDIYSNQIGSQHIESVSAITNFLAFDRSFQSTLNVPTIIKGDVISNIGWALRSGGAGTASGSIVLEIYKNSELLAQSSFARVVSNSVYREIREVITNIPLTKYKKGDTLKIRQYAYLSGSGVGSYEIYLGHDPKLRDYGQLVGGASGAYTTNLVKIPFVIDI